MKRQLAVMLAVALAVILVAGSAMAAGGPTYDKKSKNNGPRGNSNNGNYWLVEKDQDWEIVTRDQDGAYGHVKYNLSGSSFDFKLSAHRLDPDTKYQIEFGVVSDNTPPPTWYAVASVASNSDGNITYSASLAQFEELIGVGPFFDDATPITPDTEYTIKIFIKNDGNPTSGTCPEGLPYSGNGDSNYDYRLFEFLPLTFTGA